MGNKICKPVVNVADVILEAPTIKEESPVVTGVETSMADVNLPPPPPL